MNRLTCSEAEIFSERAYARSHEVAGRRLHGGLDADGRYVPPRSKGRNEALVAWAMALGERRGDLFAADPSLLTEPEGDRVLAQFDRLSDLPEPEVSVG